MRGRRLFSLAAVLPYHFFVTLEQFGHLQLQAVDHTPLLDHHIIPRVERVVLERLAGFKLDDSRFR